MIMFYEFFRDIWYYAVHITLLAFKTHLFIFGCAGSSLLHMGFL